MGEKLEAMQYCVNCGAELGRYKHYHGDMESCGEPECRQELRAQYEMREAEARERAERDGFGLYGGYG